SASGDLFCAGTQGLSLYFPAYRRPENYLHSSDDPLFHILILHVWYWRISCYPTQSLYCFSSLILVLTLFRKTNSEDFLSIFLCFFILWRRKNRFENRYSEMDGERKEEIAEDVCFFCKDGGELRICDFKSCLKAYHAPCVGKDLKFLELDEYWTCGWHSCFLCQKSSIFQCFCCPRSICEQCMGAASFVVLRKGKGFCVECLKLALMIENDMDVDSDGGQVDFTDTETLEFLFKDYWPILKEKEKLSIDDLRKADEILKKTSKDTRIILDKNSDDDMKLDKEYSQEDAEIIGRSAFRSKGTCISSKVKKIVQRYKSKKKQFIGWGSKELIGFLQSIGKATDKEFSQAEVFDIVKEYIQENKLLNPHKRKRVLCDSRLRALFGRKSISRLKINDLLDPHFASNELPDDEAGCSSEDENERKCQKLGSNQKSGKAAWKRNTMAARKNAFACITVKNIRAVYLRRSLVEEFLKSVESFDSKVTGCFVRIRSDAKTIHRSSHTLVQVTGTKNLTENYRTGNMQTNIVLLVSDSDKDIRIHMISEDEFTEN
ncbi:Zinc finger CCCH domain-containing protein 19, partial [Nymphaea thermarum]